MSSSPIQRAKSSSSNLFGSEKPQMKESLTIIVIGASGDLAKKKNFS